MSSSILRSSADLDFDDVYGRKDPPGTLLYCLVSYLVDYTTGNTQQV